MNKTRNIDLHLNLAEFEQEIIEHTSEIYKGKFTMGAVWRGQEYSFHS